MSHLKHLILFSIFQYSLIFNRADSTCSKVFECGSLGTLEYPLSNRRECGLFFVRNCTNTGPYHHPLVQFGAGEGLSYSILQKISTNSLLIYNPAMDYLRSPLCWGGLGNLSLPVTPSASFTVVTPNLTVFLCTNQSSDQRLADIFEHYLISNCSSFQVYYRDPSSTYSVPDNIPEYCSAIQVPVNTRGNPNNLSDFITPEFVVEWSVSEACNECHNGGGRCLTNHVNHFRCGRGADDKRRKVVIASLGVGISVSVTFTIIVFLSNRKHHTFLNFSRTNARREHDDIERFLKEHGNLAPKRYKYSQLKKMTKSFSESLGKGGYGNVYKGRLPDGRLVAVKTLNKQMGSDGAEFINEVSSISRTSHVNVVTLLGFCFEGSKRALVYDFMPNGSLEKYIQSKDSKCVLGWEKMFEITLAVARGLEYLHQGCNTRILHFDIKPHNILLDKDFNPKISDFGLAKLCPNRSSIVSMLVARGTIGYIAPEVFCMNFGEVSYKSDVYSYGMLVLEIAGGKSGPRDVDRSSEMYFPQYIYKRLEEEIVRDCGMIENEGGDEELLMMRKLIIVGLWCIQTDPNERPSMSKVVEMLEGELESLQVPPKPYLSSPPRLTLDFSTS